MALAHVANRGTASLKAAGAALDALAGANIVADRLVVVWAAWDNSDAIDAETTRLTASDEQANTYARAVEFTQGAVGVAAGATCVIGYAVTAAQVDVGDFVRVTSTDANRVAKVMSVHEFSKAAGTTIAVEDYDAGGGTGGGSFSATLAGMTSREYLLAGVFVFERGDHASLGFTQDSDYTSIDFASTVGGAANSNLSLFGGFRVATLTGDTWGISVGAAAGECAHALVAFYEVADVGAFELDAQPGTITVTGAAAAPLAGRTLPADPGSLTVTGAAAAVPAGRVVFALPGTYTLTGSAAGTLADRILNAAAGSFTVTGLAAELVYQPTAGAFELNAAPGVYTISGAAASPVAARLFTASPGSYTLTGSDVGVPAGRAITAAAGSYTLTGAPTGQLTSRTLAAAAGAYTVAGLDAGLEAGILSAIVTAHFDQPNPAGGFDPGTANLAGGADPGSPDGNHFDQPTPTQVLA